MSKIKFTVTAEALESGSDGVTKYVKYLSNAKHANHRNTTGIEVLWHSEHGRTMSLAVNEYELKRQGLRGSRSLGAHGTSFCLTLPSGNGHIKTDNWKNIVKHTIYYSLRTMYRKDFSEAEADEKAKKYLAGSGLHAVLHRQKSGKDHVHLILPKVFDDEIVRFISQKPFLNCVKQNYSQMVFRYQPDVYEKYGYQKTSGAKESKQRRVKMHQYLAEQQKQQIASLDNEVESKLAELTAISKDLKQFRADAKIKKDEIKVLNESNNKKVVDFIQSMRTAVTYLDRFARSVLVEDASTVVKRQNQAFMSIEKLNEFIESDMYKQLASITKYEIDALPKAVNEAAEKIEKLHNVEVPRVKNRP